MWQTAACPSDHSSAVSVVPMPSTAGLAMIFSCSRALAVATAMASTFSMSPSSAGSASSSAIDAMVSALATSPAAWPPIPSATASRRGPAYAESSFPSRRRPTSERTA